LAGLSAQWGMALGWALWPGLKATPSVAAASGEIQSGCAFLLQFQQKIQKKA